MRWPLKYQIAIPMAAVMLLAIATASGLNAWFAARSTRQRIEGQIRNAAALLAGTNFPLTDNVLRQLQALSRADFVLVDPQGKVRASSTPGMDVPRTHKSHQSEALDRLALDGPMELVGQGSYFHAQLALSPRAGSASGDILHILYPVAEYRAAWQAAIVPSLAVVLVAVPMVIGLAITVAAAIGRRSRQLQQQLRRIADGDFRAAPVPRRNDEIRELAAGVNRTASMLAAYEEQIRQRERMSTLAQLGGAMAHQLRNSVTGCRLALDFHKEDCPLTDQDESLAVASRQLELMEEYVQRFLQLGRAQDAGHFERVDLASVVSSVLPLVVPSARHAHVDLHWRPPESQAIVEANRAELSQLLINLMLNAIEAAARPATAASGAQVRLQMDRPTQSHVRISISDTGPGPSPALHERLFEPFVSEKADGVGLGLSVARTIAQQHDAALSWERDDGWTHFRLELPLSTDAASHRTERLRAETPGR